MPDVKTGNQHSVCMSVWECC